MERLVPQVYQPVQRTGMQRYLLNSVGLLLVALFGLAQTVTAQTYHIKTLGEPAEIVGEWKFQPGDNLEWAKPGFADADWKSIRIDQSWGTQGYEGLGGFAWYRVHLRLDPQAIPEPVHNQLGILLGGAPFCPYEVYAGGEKVGSFGTFPPQESFPFEFQTFHPIPFSAISPQGELVVAVRVWRQPAVARMVPGEGGFSNYKPTFGTFSTLEVIRQSIVQQQQLRDLPDIVLTVVFIFFGLYHLQFFFKRRQQLEYLWFGLFAVSFGIDAFWGCHFWVGKLFHNRDSVLRLTLIFTNLDCWLVMGFLWTFLEVPMGKAVRWYRHSFLVLGCFGAGAPRLDWQVGFILLLLAWILPLLGLVLWLVVREAWRGNPEARTITWGVGALAGIQLLEVLEAFRFLPERFSNDLLSFGFLVLLMSMAVALSNRFSRVHGELDALTVSLETKVVERTQQLADANHKLEETVGLLEVAKNDAERKNEELDHKNLELDRNLQELNRINEQLVVSQQQADRIFSALAEALPGTVLDGKYRLDERIGAGGFGIVFRATQLSLNRTVAVKVFRPKPGNDSPEAVERFRLEGISAARLQHRNAIAVLDSGISSDGIAFLVMEYLHGRSLRDELRFHPVLPWRRCREVLTPVAQALVEAHRLGIIHRDIKPENIFLHQTPEGEIVKVVDFGIAKLIGEDSSQMAPQLTGTGVMIGTPLFMAPERLAGDPYDGQSDVYSLGVMLYHMLSGQFPLAVTGGTMMHMAIAHLRGERIPLSRFNPKIPPELEAFVMRLLEPSPQNRPNMAEVVNWLRKAPADYDVMLRPGMVSQELIETLQCTETTNPENLSLETPTRSLIETQGKNILTTLQETKTLGEQ
ncbi:MAG: protein kinase [Blastocatellia bacterium]|nr:protein kinase [Blastocatellia bacterium]